MGTALRGVGRSPTVALPAGVARTADVAAPPEAVREAQMPAPAQQSRRSHLLSNLDQARKVAGIAPRLRQCRIVAALLLKDATTDELVAAGLRTQDRMWARDLSLLRTLGLDVRPIAGFGTSNLTWHLETTALRRGQDEVLWRALALIPAVGSGACVSAVCARLCCTPAELHETIDLLSCVGVPPYAPDDLVEMELHRDRVRVVQSQRFDRLRLLEAVCA